MKPTPLDKIGLRWRDHKSALWWLGLLYRRPVEFYKALRVLPKRDQFLFAFRLYCHHIVYLFLLFAFGKSFLFKILRIITFVEINFSYDFLFFHIFGIIGGIILGLIAGSAGGFSGRFAGGLPEELQEGLQEDFSESSDLPAMFLHSIKISAQQLLLELRKGSF